LTGSRAQITSLAYSPSGEYLAAGDSSGKIIVYSISSGDYTVKSRAWAFHVARITSLKFNSTGSHCVSGSLDTHVYIWSTLSFNKYIAIKNASKDGVWGVSWLGENRVVSSGGDGAVKVWDVAI
jgi:WD40 repeat protein